MPNSLYEKYGGFKTISRIVISFYETVLDSDDVGHHFDGVDMNRLIDHQTKFMSALLGGPVSFNDERLHTLHRGLNITDPEFDAIMDILRDALMQHGMGETDIEFTLQEIEKKRPIIVSRRSP